MTKPLALLVYAELTSETEQAASAKSLGGWVRLGTMEGSVSWDWTEGAVCGSVFPDGGRVPPLYSGSHHLTWCRLTLGPLGELDSREDAHLWGAEVPGPLFHQHSFM